MLHLERLKVSVNNAAKVCKLTPVMKVKDTFVQTESKDEISSWMEMNSILYPTFVHFTFGLCDYFLM